MISFAAGLLLAAAAVRKPPLAGAPPHTARAANHAQFGAAHPPGEPDSVWEGMSRASIEPPNCTSAWLGTSTLQELDGTATGLETCQCVVAW